MKGDFTRDTFRPKKHYSGVRMQQGRVQMDADWNEQVDIDAYLEQTQAVDVIGASGVPKDGGGFSIEAIASGANADLAISPGRIYVDGILCELEGTATPAKYESTKMLSVPELAAGGQPWAKYEWVRAFGVAPAIKAQIDNLDRATGTLTLSVKSALASRALHVGMVRNAHASTEVHALRVDKVLAAQGKATVSILSPSVPNWAKDQELEILSAPTSRWLLTSKDGVKVGERVRLAFEGSVEDLRGLRRLELTRFATYRGQPDYPRPDDLPDPKNPWLVYLDVWQRHITALEDPEIREQALNGPDTATRTKTVWQVKVASAPKGNTCCERFSALVQELRAKGNGGLRARARPQQDPDDPCIIQPGAGYRRLENQLYRVEIHGSGKTGDPNTTFKWSRENGSVVASWESVDGKKLTVKSLGYDRPLGFVGDEWVELTDDSRELGGKPGLLVRLEEARDNVLTMADDSPVVQIAPPEFHPKVRRWDMTGDKLENQVKAPANDDDWIPLEGGVEIQFEAGKNYQCGDYWLIPARAAKGEIEWPDTILQPKHGIRHHYACLAQVTWTRRLFSVKPDGSPGESGLIESVKINDGTITCKLVDGVRLFDGQPFNAAALERVLARYQGSIPAYKSRQVDDKTLEITFEGPINDKGKLYRQLSAITVPTDSAVVDPCYSPFPPLTAITAEDVSFDNRSFCKMVDADTVQEALEALCQHYRVLRYVGGDGQQGPPKEQLPCPLWVGVEDENGKPVAGARVEFQTSNSDSLAPNAGWANVASPGQPFTLETDANGMASAWWILGDPAKDRCHHVIARLAASPPKEALCVQFEAHEEAADLPTDLPTVERINWENDRLLPAQLLQNGIGLEVTFSRPMQEEMVKPSTFIVTLELPEKRTYKGPGNTQISAVGHVSWIVPGTVEHDDSRRVWRFRLRFINADVLAYWQQLQSSAKLEAGRIRGRVLLKGNLIMGQNGKYLDGEARGKPDTYLDNTGKQIPFTKLHLPSGYGREGSDFESWFWLPAEQ